MDKRENYLTWKRLHQDPKYREILREEIRTSWERSYAYGVNPFTDVTFRCTEEELIIAKTKAKGLLDVATDVMYGLYNFFAGHSFVVALADINGCGLKVIGDEESLELALKGGLVEGTVWSEEVAGTNSGALAIALGRPATVVGYENFCRFGQMAGSASVPIFDKGVMLGVLSVEGYYHRMNLHTLGMTVAAVRHIESNLILERARKQNELILEAIPDAVMVIDDRGTITFVNDNWLNIFRQSRNRVLGLPLIDCLGTEPGNRDFIAAATSRANLNDNITIDVGRDRLKCSITSIPLENNDEDPQSTLVLIRPSQQVDRLVRSWIGSSAKISFSDIVGEDPEFKTVLTTAQAAASSCSNMLLLGESGTGKDMIAQAIHNASQRRNHSFVAINCAALPRELIASELFGYEDGAFTGARKGGNMGKFELADQGTIFLDEIGDMPLDLQVSLLRVLEEKCIVRLGSNKQIPVDVRIIAATNQDLQSQITNRRFRQDLYYRLSVVTLVLPPLRERPQDIILLARKLTETICQRFKKPTLDLSDDVLELLISYHWPGNVREMQNVLERAVQLASGSVITRDLVIQGVKPNYQPPQVEPRQLPIFDFERRYELEMLREYLERYDNNKAKTARALGISRKTLYRWLKILDSGSLSD